mmetsp:Transcript_15603/g.17338  ORF Transcript_15603/g.17338 Transcript_15603/m.17338 type:complete len:143 (+) Transcript_15603:1136-1564(+)
MIKFTTVPTPIPCTWNSGCEVSELENLALTSENPYADNIESSATFTFSYEGVNSVGISFVSDPVFADTGDVLAFSSTNDTDGDTIVKTLTSTSADFANFMIDTPTFKLHVDTEGSRNAAGFDILATPLFRLGWWKSGCTVGD